MSASGPNPDHPVRDDGPVGEAWRLHRRRVLDIGYRMLGSLSDAEDVAQDVFARLLVADADAIADVEAWLVTVTSRLCLDRLRLHENSRRSYVGPWLPEPIVGSDQDEVADRVTLDESVRMAFLVVLDRLGPAERAAFLLHDVFGIPFPEVAEIVGRTPQACRQLATRARRRIHDGGPRSRGPIDVEHQRLIVERFGAACRDGDVQALIDVLSPDATGDFDSGGVIADAPLVELSGAEPIARQLVATVSRLGASFEARQVNGVPGLIVAVGGRVLVAMSFVLDGDRIALIHGVGNPAKLTHLQPPSPQPAPGTERDGESG